MGFQTIGDMVVSITGENSQFDSAIDKSEKRFLGFSAKAISIGKSLTMFVTAPLLGLAGAALKSTATMEALEASFAVMIGNAKQATILMNDLKRMAAVTPFETTDLANASKTLLQFGTNVKDLLPTLKMLGDASGGNNNRFNSMALVFGQIQSMGRLMGQDLLQLINAGFNPLQEISKKTGESMAVLKERMSKGGVSAKEVAEAFKTATSEGGRFFNGMNIASKTLEGLISTLKDDISTFGRSMVDGFLPAIKDTVKYISSLAQYLTNLDDGTKKTIVNVALFAAALGPLAFALGTLTKAMSALKVASLFLIENPVVLGIVAVAAGITAIGVAALDAKVKQSQLNAEIKKTEDAKKPLSDVDKYNQALKIQMDAEKKLIIYKRELNDVVSDDPILQAGYVKATNSLIRDQEALIKLSSIMLPVLKLQADAERSLNASLVDHAEVAEKIANTSITKTIPFQQKQTRELQLTNDAYDSLNDKVLTNTEVTNENILSMDNMANALKDMVTQTDKAIDDLALPKWASDVDAGFEMVGQTGNDLFRTLVPEVKNLGDVTVAQTVRMIDALSSVAENGDVVKAFNSMAKSIAGTLGPEGAIAIAFLNLGEKLNEVVRNINADILEAQGGYADKIMGIDLRIVNAKMDNRQKEYDNAVSNLDKLGLSEQEYADEKIRLENAFNKDMKQFAKDKAILDRDIALAQIKIDKQKAIADMGFLGWITGKSKEVGNMYDDLITLVQATPLPMAQGGIVMPSIGGTVARVAEAGQPEVIFPLDQLNKFLRDVPSTNTGVSGDSGGNINLIVQIDSEPILQKIFPATRNRTVRIDAGAVV
ncbi:tape measure protein [Candidatus Dojkabacteria bacterium]|nr:tape measure protein [Candidatus Dojkabacteria bacterium]